MRYKRTEKFVNAFFSKFDEFHKPPRHPLWKEVNLGATIPGWTRYAAAEEWLNNWRAGQAKSDEADFKEFMKGRTANKATDQLFREFMIWRSRGK